MDGRVSVRVVAPEGELVISGPLVVLRRFLVSVGGIPPALDDDEEQEAAWPWPPDPRGHDEVVRAPRAPSTRDGPAPLRLRR